MSFRTCTLVPWICRLAVAMWQVHGRWRWGLYTWDWIVFCCFACWLYYVCLHLGVWSSFLHVGNYTAWEVSLVQAYSYKWYPLFMHVLMQFHNILEITDNLVSVMMSLMYICTIGLFISWCLCMLCSGKKSPVYYHYVLISSILGPNVLQTHGPMDPWTHTGRNSWLECYVLCQHSMRCYYMYYLIWVDIAENIKLALRSCNEV